MRAFVSLAAAAVAVLGVGCAPNIRGIDTDLNRSVSRTLLNDAKRACMLEARSCGRAGVLFAHADTSSMRKTWTEPLDQANAIAAFDRGCRVGEAQSCRALVELGIVTGSARDAAVRRAAFYGMPARPKAAVDAERAKDAAEAAKLDLANDQSIARRQAEADAEASRAFWSGAQAAADASWRTYRYSVESQAAVKAATDTHLDPTTRMSRALEHANEASRAITDKPLVGKGGVLVDICVPCTDEAKLVTVSCKDPASDGCLTATRVLDKCLGEKHCGAPK
jgi:hypothetical protein